MTDKNAQSVIEYALLLGGITLVLYGLAVSGVLIRLKMAFLQILYNIEKVFRIIESW